MNDPTTDDQLEPEPVGDAPPAEDDPPVLGGRYAIRILWVLVAAVVILGGLAIKQRSNDAAQDRRAAARDRTVAITIQNNTIDDAVARCESSNEFRDLFRGYLETQASGFTVEDVTGLPGYNDLDPNTRQFVYTLAAASAAGAADAERIRQAYIEGFPIQNCKKVRKDMEAKARRILKASENGVPIAYGSCKEAIDAGAAPLTRGEPGYNPALDRDKDGTACGS